MSDETKTDWTYLVWGLGWCLVFLGMGGCIYLTNASQHDKPLIVIELNTSKK